MEKARKRKIEVKKEDPLPRKKIKPDEGYAMPAVFLLRQWCREAGIADAGLNPFYGGYRGLEDDSYRGNNDRRDLRSGNEKRVYEDRQELDRTLNEFGF